MNLEIPGIEHPIEIGRGGFATVYRARQATFDRDVAVKMLNVGGLSEESRARFERECRTMGRLSSHPNIVTVFDAGITDGGQPYLVMAYVPGGSLADRSDAEGPLPWPWVTEVGVKLAGALESAHQAGVLHRDVKPANALVSVYGEPLLTDFGIARVTGDPAVTATGRASGTPAFTPPEVFAGAEPSAAGDVYSLGATLYALLNGRPAFVTDSGELMAVIAAAASQPPPEPEGVPGPLWEVIEQAMAKEPGDRHRAAAEFGGALRSAQAELGLAVTALPLAGGADASDAATRTATSVDATARRSAETRIAVETTGGDGGRRRARWLLGAAAAVVAVIVAALGLIAILDGGDDAPPTVATTTSPTVAATKPPPTDPPTTVAAPTTPPSTTTTLSPSPEFVETEVIEVGAEPNSVSGIGDDLWVTNIGDSTVTYVDTAAGEALGSDPVTGGVGGTEYGRGFLWIASGPGVGLSRLDVGARGTEPAFIALGEGRATDVTLGEGMAWVSNAPANLVHRVDATSLSVSADIPVDGNPFELAMFDGALWVSRNTADLVSKIDPETNSVVADVPVGSRPLGLVAGPNALWVTNRSDNTLSRIDPVAEEVTHTIPVGDTPDAVTYGLGFVWVANFGDRTVSVVDPETVEVIATVEVGARPGGLAVVGESVWVANGGDGTVSRIQRVP